MCPGDPEVSPLVAEWDFVHQVAVLETLHMGRLTSSSIVQVFPNLAGDSPVEARFRRPDAADADPMITRRVRNVWWKLTQASKAEDGECPNPLFRPINPKKKSKKKQKPDAAQQACLNCQLTVINCMSVFVATGGGVRGEREFRSWTDLPGTGR